MPKSVILSILTFPLLGLKILCPLSFFAADIGDNLNSELISKERIKVFEAAVSKEISSVVKDKNYEITVVKNGILLIRTNYTWNKDEKKEISDLCIQLWKKQFQNEDLKIYFDNTYVAHIVSGNRKEFEKYLSFYVPVASSLWGKEVLPQIDFDKLTKVSIILDKWKIPFVRKDSALWIDKIDYIAVKDSLRYYKLIDNPRVFYDSNTGKHKVIST